MEVTTSKCLEVYNISKAKHEDWGADWSLGNVYI